MCTLNMQIHPSLYPHFLGKVWGTFLYFPVFVGKFAVFFVFSRMCYNIEIFGTHLKFFLENGPALYGFTGTKTGNTFRYLFLLEHVEI